MWNFLQDPLVSELDTVLIRKKVVSRLLAPDGYMVTEYTLLTPPPLRNFYQKKKKKKYQLGEMHVRMGSHGKGPTIFWNPWELSAWHGAGEIGLREGLISLPLTTQEGLAWGLSVTEASWTASSSARGWRGRWATWSIGKRAVGPPSSREVHQVLEAGRHLAHEMNQHCQAWPWMR